MKGLKITAIVLGGVVVLTTLALVLALTPAVQTWAVRKAVAGQPGMKLGVERVDAGFSAANVTDFSYSQDGIIVTAKGVSAKYSAWDYLTSGKINADDVSVQELVVDLRNATPAGGTANPAGSKPIAAPAGTTKAPGATTAAAAKPAPFDGLLKQLQLMFDVRVGNIAAKGRALLPDQQTVVFDLKGASIATGERGKLEWTVDFADSKLGAALRALRTSGTLSIHIAADRRIDVVEIDGTAAALGPNLPADQFRLTAKAEQPKAGGNETYAASIGINRGGKIEPLAKTTAQWDVAKREITGAWDLAVRTEQLAAVLSGLGLPDVAATGNGRFQFKPDSLAAQASGELQARASRLQKLSPDLEAVGSVELKATFDGGMADNLARLDKLSVDLTAADGRKFAQISTLQKVTYGLTDQKVTLADPKAELARISLQALPLAWAQPFAKPLLIESGDLSLNLAAEVEPDGSRVRVRAIDPLSLRAVTVRDAARKALVEKLTLTVRPNLDYSTSRVAVQLAELSISLPAGDAVTGNLTANVTNLKKAPQVAFNAQLQAKIVALLKPYLPVDTGPLAVTLAVEGEHTGQSLNLAKAGVTVNREGGALLAAVEMLQPVRADLKAATFAAANPAATVGRLRLGEVPLAWAEAFVPKSKLSGAFAGTTLEVTMRTADDLTVATTAPVTLRGVGASLNGQALVQGLDLSASLSATKRGPAVSYDLSRLELRQGETSLATLSASGQAKLGTKPTVASKGSLDADLAALMKQPALSAYATLSRGRMTATFDASMAEATEAKVVVVARDLVAKQGNQPLGTLETTLTASVKPDGSGTILAPLTLTNGTRKSDLAVTGTFGRSANQESLIVAGKISSANLIIDDLQALAVLAPATPAATAPAPTAERVSPTTTVIRAPRPGTPASTPATSPAATAAAKPARDAQPFWKGASGKVELDLKRILYGQDYVISGIRGTAVVSDTRLSLDGLEGKFKENPFKVAAGITFAAQLPKPYTLAGSVDVQNLDIGEILRAANPNEKPALETKATLTARLNGNGTNVVDLGMNAFGKFELSGTKGTMRYLARKGTAGAVVNIASFGLAMLGASKGSDTTMAIAELTKALNEVSFDSIKLQVERGADLTFKLTSMELISPILRMTGSGSVAAKKPEEVQNSPMNVVLQLAAKGELGYLLQRVGMLGANKDEKGYQLMSRTFSIGGTPSNPDNSALWKLLLEAGLGAFGR